MMKTPEEIKRGLRVCDSVGRVIKAESWCKEKCPYMDEKFGCGQDYLLADALAYIQQLEDERDAAVTCIPRVCKYCKHDGPLNAWGESECEFDSLFPNGCLNGNTRWEWRGVQKEE